MHDNVVLAGPVWWTLVGLLFVAAMTAFVMAIDALRSKRRGRLAELPEPWWLYTVLFGGWLLFFFVAQFPILPDVTAAVLAGSVPLVIAAEFTYLLRVVFPKPAAAPADPASGSEPLDG